MKIWPSSSPRSSVATFFLGLSALLWFGAIVGVTTSTTARAAARAPSRVERVALREIGKARAALDRKKGAVAIPHAEAAVALQPKTSGYRLTLGRSYLKAGRFASACAAFRDALALDPTNGTAALSYALMQIGTGDWADARATLEASVAIIPVSDRGLAIALAGDPVTAVELLEPAARAADATATTRQNYALSLALAGRWRDAQAVVEVDLSRVDAARRLLEWSTFSRPTSASDQIAALLGVVPVQDAGQPGTLALARERPIARAQAAVSPRDAEATQLSQIAGKDASPRAPVVEKADRPATPVLAATTLPAIVFAPRKEVVQALPIATAALMPALGQWSREETGRAAVARASVSGGTSYVQLGAFESVAVAQAAWVQAARRFPALARHVPQSADVADRTGRLHRLSIGGLARGDAIELCREYRVRGGQCFVRGGAGDQAAAWTRRLDLAER